MTYGAKRTELGEPPEEGSEELEREWPHGESQVRLLVWLATVISSHRGELVSTLGWIVLIVVLMVVFGGYRFTKKR